MKEKLHSLLNIKASEAQLVFDLMCVQLFSGIATSFLLIISFTLFLHSFPEAVQMLPWLYLLIAGVLSVMNIFYEKTEHKFSPVQVMKIVFITCIITLIALWIGVINSETFVIILIAWGTVLYMLTGYAFWGFASLLFNVRESKRVFAIIGSGDIPSKLIGYLAVPLMIPIVGIENLSDLLWVAVIAYTIALFLVIKLFDKKPELHQLSHAHGHEHAAQELNKKGQGFINLVFKTELIFAISILSIITYNVFNLIDYTFLSQVKLKFSDSQKLASFIAIFFAGGRILALFFKLVFTSRIIGKWGIVYSLLISPVILLIFCISVFLLSHDVTTQLYIFGGMVLLTEVLRSTIQEPVFLVIFQPLRKQLRLKGHIIAKGYMLPPSLIIVGGTLLLLIHSSVTITISLIVEILIANIILWALVIFYIQKTYLSTLHHSVKKGTFEGAEIFTNNPSVIKILEEKVKHGKDVEIIYALHVLESIHYENLLPLLMQQLESKETEVKKYVIKRIHELKYNAPETIAKLKRLFNTEHEPEVINLLIDTLMELDRTFFSAYATKFADLEPELKKIVLVQLIKNGEFDELLPAANELNKLIFSPRAEERITGLDIITELKSLKFNKIIKELLEDKNASVRKKAIRVIVHLHIDELLPSIINLLNDSADRFFATKTLIEYGDDLFNVNKNFIDFRNYNVLLHFIKVAAKVKGEHSTNFLLTLLAKPDIPKNQIINALWEKKHEATVTDREKIENIFSNIIENAVLKTQSYYSVPQFSDTSLLRRTILDEVKMDLITALKTASMLYDSKKINRVTEVFNLSENNKIHNAIEMLEMILPKKRFHEINQLIEFTLNTNSGVKPEKIKNLQTVLEEIIYSKSNGFSAWTKALSIYIAGKNHVTGLIGHLSGKPAENEDFIIHETKSFVLAL